MKLECKKITGIEKLLTFLRDWTGHGMTADIVLFEEEVEGVPKRAIGRVSVDEWGEYLFESVSVEPLSEGGAAVESLGKLVSEKNERIVDAALRMEASETGLPYWERLAKYNAAMSGLL